MMKHAAVLAVAVLSVCTACGKTDGFDMDAFLAPPAEYAPGFFWMWKDKLDEKKLLGQLDEMHSNGIRAVCVHPFPREFRPGRFHSDMSPAYLSDDYLNILKRICDRAGELGMNFWMYDEGGWPSGGACGQVAASDVTGRWLPATISASDTPPGYKIVTESAYGSGRQSYPSIVEKGCTERFLELTHDKLYAAMKGAFGRQIKFAFTDEPEYPRVEWAGQYPWTRDFPEYFRAKKGYDILPHMKDILRTFKTGDPSVTPFRLDYFEVVSDLFVERYMLPIRDWCRAHGIKSSGHVDGEDQPESIIKYGNGNILKTLRAMDAPGVDVIWRQLWPDKGQAFPGRQVPFPRYATSAARQTGGRHVLSESFGIYGSSLTPGEKKWLVDYQMVRGVNQFVFGYYAMSYAGQWMMLFEPHNGPISPIWSFEAPYYRYIHRVSALMATGEAPVDVAVLYDMRGLWAGGADTEIAAAQHYAIARILDRRHVEYDFIDEDPIVEARIADGALHVGPMRYKTLVLPSCRWMKPQTKAKLEAFQAAGGRVLGIDGIAEIRPVCRITGPRACDMRVAKRVKGTESLYFIVNESPNRRDIAVNFDEHGRVVRVDAVDGVFIEEPRSRDGEISFMIDGYGSALFLVNTDIPASRPCRAGDPLLALKEGWLVTKLARHYAGKEALEKESVEENFAPAVLGDWRPFLGWNFSGSAKYRIEFDWLHADNEALLDLGKVCWTCRATFNGIPLSEKFFGPFVWRVKPKHGKNVLEVEVANTLANALSADETRLRIRHDFPPACPSYEPKQSVFDKENNESGLFGPVEISRCVR